MRIALLGPGKGGLYRQVIFICRWSLGQVQLYLEQTNIGFNHTKAHYTCISSRGGLARESIQYVHIILIVYHEESGENPNNDHTYIVCMSRYFPNGVFRGT